MLALQGDFAKHAEVIRRLGYLPKEIRVPEGLSECDALIIPGGESTTLQKLFSLHNFDQAIKDFAAKRPVMGTCAGLIILSRRADHLEQPPLGLIDIDVMRNAYGRQRESFYDNIELSLNGSSERFEGVFIRAPRIVRMGAKVISLGRHRDEVVIASADGILVCTFHPELTGDSRIHRYFIEKHCSL